MNSMNLEIMAGKAIEHYRRTHNQPCILHLRNRKVVCFQASEGVRPSRNMRYISKFEMDHGLTQSRWRTIGNELHNLYCKELACHTHPKH